MYTVHVNEFDEVHAARILRISDIYLLGQARSLLFSNDKVSSGFDDPIAILGDSLPPASQSCSAMNYEAVS